MAIFNSYVKLSGLHLRFAVSILIFWLFLRIFLSTEYSISISPCLRAPLKWPLHQEILGHTRRLVIRFPIVFPQKRTDSESSLKKILWLLNILYVNRADLQKNRADYYTL